MSADLTVARSLALVALASLAGCVDEPARAPAPPTPAPVVAPEPSTVVPPAPAVVEPPSVPRPILAWRVGATERASILFAVPPYPASLDEVLVRAWSAELARIHRLVVLASPADAGALMLRHGLGSATADLREVLGDDAFDRLARRLEGIDARTNRMALAGVDPRGASLLLVVAELGYRAPGDGVLDQLMARFAERGDAVVPLIDAGAFARWAEAPSDADVVGELRVRIADPNRTTTWSAAQRDAYERADLGALSVACEEPTRTSGWNEATRRANRELAGSLVDPVARELGGEPALVALDGCLFAGEGGLVATLRARGLELVPLGGTTPSPATVSPVPAVAEPGPAPALDPRVPPSAPLGVVPSVPPAGVVAPAPAGPP